MLCNPRMQTRVLESRADLNLDQLMSPSAIETVRTAGTHTHAYAFSPMQSITCTCTRCIHSGVHGVCMYAMCVLQARTAHASVKILTYLLTTYLLTYLLTYRLYSGSHGSRLRQDPQLTYLLTYLLTYRLYSGSHGSRLRQDPQRQRPPADLAPIAHGAAAQVVQGQGPPRLHYAPTAHT